MKINQLLYGYREGHRLLAGSIDLNESLVWNLVRATDRPSVTSQELESGITFGFTLDKQYYALCRTWAAKEIDRPGAVWTHVLLLPNEIESPIECLPLLHKVTHPDEADFLQPKIYNQETLVRNRSTLSKEGVCLLLQIAAKPTACLRAYSDTPPLVLFENVQSNWSGILHNQSFATSIGKKDVVADKKSIVISAFDPSMSSLIDQIYLSDKNIKIPSERITHSWNAVNQEPILLQEWLAEVGKGIKQTATNLKLVLEALLLGTGELDDNKLLKRISNAVNPKEGLTILRYSLGNQFNSIKAPPSWVAALFLMSEENWGKWEHLINAEHVGRSAATAPIPKLAVCLVNLAKCDDARLALKELSKVIAPEAFESLHEFSENASSVLVRLNPDLLFLLPRVDQGYRRLAAITVGQEGRDLPWDLELLSRAPSIARKIIAAGIRLARSENELIAFAAMQINNGAWDKLSSIIKTLLIETPLFLDESIRLNPTKKVMQTLLKEFSLSQVVSGINRIMRNESYKTDRLADSLVEIYGAENNIVPMSSVTGVARSKFIAAVAEARWHCSQSVQVLNRIMSDFSEHNDLSVTNDLIKDKDLRAALAKADQIKKKAIKEKQERMVKAANKAKKK